MGDLVHKSLSLTAALTLPSRLSVENINLCHVYVVGEIFRFEKFQDARKNIRSLTSQDIAKQRPLWNGRNPGKIIIIIAQKISKYIFSPGGLSVVSHVKQLSGLVVERLPATLKAGFQTRGGEHKNFQYRLSSAETQQPVDRMRRKARGCLVLSVLC